MSVSCAVFISMFVASRRVGMRILLPAILLFCSILETDALLGAVKDHGVDYDTRVMLLHGRNQLAEFAQGQLKHFYSRRPQTCILHVIANADAIRILCFPFSVSIMRPQLCAACHSIFWERIEGLDTGDREGWQKLPTLWDLPPWEKLRVESASFLSDVPT